MPFQIFLCAILVTAVRARVNLESPGHKKRRSVKLAFLFILYFSLVQNLLVPLEIEDLTAALITLHNSSLVDLSHVQVQGTAVAEGH